VIRVLVAEDQHLIRGALLALIGLEDDMAVVAEVERGDAILATARRVHPDVAVLDIDLPGHDGLTAAASLREELPETRVLILTGLGQPGHLTRALEARVGGFMRKDAPSEELADAIRRVAKGQRFLDPDLVAVALEVGTSPLTARETEVLRAAADGGTTEDIGQTLFLSPATVRNYLSNAIGKLGARNRLDAIRIARDSGWL
jgi:two-component system response regulator DesR